MTTAVPDISSQRHFLARLIAKGRGPLADAQRFAYGESRRYTPTLRPAAMAITALVVALALLICAALLCWLQLSTDLRDRLATADRALAIGLQEIDRDLEGLMDVQSAQEASTCSEPVRELLTRAALNSLLVREFLTVDPSGERACGSFGGVTPYWSTPTPSSATSKDLYIVPAQSIRPTLVVMRQELKQSLVALVEPRQLMDRLPPGANGQKLRLLSSEGQVLAMQGGRPTGPNAFAPISLAIHGWPLVIEGAVEQDQFLVIILAQWPFWTMAWIFLTFCVIGVANALARRHSSRALRLQRALRKRRFSPVVQPIVDARSGRCLGAEILMRWKHPTRGLVPPAEFIDYAERSGLIVPMSDLLMRQAHRQLAECALAYPELYFSFNVTPTQLRTPGFSKTLEEIFDGEPLGPQRVVLELTERDLVDDQVRDEMTRLRAFGFRVAIDDFGTGQSSLAVLQDLPIDRLKVDRAFVNTISNEQENQPVLDAIIALAHRLKISMVAEGIETKLQHDYLTAAGVQALQGYRFGRPMIPTDFRTWLDENSTRGKEVVAPEGFNPLTFDLAQVMDDLEAVRPILLKQRRHHFRRYRDCLLGNELISWLSEHYQCSRVQALRLGQRLASRGLLVHVVEEHDLQDAPFFY